MIIRESNTSRTLLTIVNYEVYQVSETPTRTVTRTPTRTVTRTVAETNNNDKNVNNEKNVVVDGDNIPTLEEVKAYCKEIESRIDPERFYDYNNVRGWKINGDPIKDWKTLLRIWGSKEKESSYLDDLADYWQREL